MQQDISSLELAKLQGSMSTMLRSHNQNYEEISFNKKVFKNVSTPHPKKKSDLDQDAIYAITSNK